MSRPERPAALRPGPRRAAGETGDLFGLSGMLEALNPWWHGAPALERCADADLPALVAVLLETPPAVVVIEGGRQTGKSHLLDALAQALLARGVAAQAICRLALETGPLRWATLAAVEDAWSARCPAGREERTFLLVDDYPEWDTPGWPRSERARLLAPLAVGRRTLVVTGGALDADVDAWRAAGLRVARWQLATCNFARFLAEAPVAAGPELGTGLPPPQSLRELFEWPEHRFEALREPLRRLTAQFHAYLWRGGYPAARVAASLPLAQQVLRDTVVMRALRWDAAARHGVRRIRELEHALDCLAAAAGSRLDVPGLCARLTVERPTVRHFLDLLEGSGLIARIPPLGYGEQVQRGRFLVALGDPGLVGSLRWQDPLAPASTQGDAARLQSALLRHLRGAYAARGGRISYVQPDRRTTCLIVSAGERQLPFGLVDASAGAPPRVSPRLPAGLASLCRSQGIRRAYLVTRLPDDFGLLPADAGQALAVMRIPAALLCLWLAAAEPSGLDQGA